MKYVKKTITGLKECDKEEADQVILGAEEYHSLMKEIEDTEKENDELISRIENSYTRKISKLKSDYNYENSSLQNKLDVYISSYNKLREELLEVKEALADEVFLNENLKRIARERANAARKIAPKKEHDGYIVLSSKQWKVKKMGKNFVTWKNVLQTPIDVSLGYDIAKRLVGEKIEDVFYDIGCYYEEEEVDSVEELFEQNRVFDLAFNANYKTGFWELEFFSSQSLDVPEERRKNVININ